MNRDDIASELARQLLNCWYLDLEYLISLIEEFNLDIDLEDIKNNYWYESLNNINQIIYSCYNDIKDKFLKTNSKEVQSITWKSINLFDDYNIFTNCIDSHLQFNNENINTLYKKRRYNLGND